uniref:BRO1 domain-containing protein n=1 Tax=Rhizochromulina marina TaxID=1034831 RepID=A0A7S2RUF9_9STRA|mmetsp:Transcript_21186/g.61851  ORF Transcript_21186/g.61851 Transcript_21186/m.61851 type:complete len:973 (+) Transcript_21186:104-3022(+)
MLAVPIKKGGAVDLVGPLSGYVAREYSQEEADAHAADFRSLQTLRTSAVNAVTAEPMALNALKRYNAQLVLSAPRLPISDKDIQVSFSWSDAFQEKKRAVQGHLNFERGCVLYNCGAVESSLGSFSDVSSAEGLKVACQHFQSAAGYFAHVRKDVINLVSGEVTPDLSEQGLSMVIQLMLAQAQACTFRKAQGQGTVKPSLLARLAQQTSVYYSQALDYAKSSGMKGVVEGSWIDLLDFHRAAYEATAQFHQAEHAHAEASNKGSGYGAEIARLELAEVLLGQALTLASKKKLDPAHAQALGDLQHNVAKRKKTAVNDNRSVYLEVVPAVSTLGPIVPASTVKPSDPQLGADTRPLFATLLPRQVRAALEEHKQQLRVSTESVESSMKQLSDEVRSHLSAVGLPGSIAAQETGGGFPQSVWAKVEAVQQAGGTWALSQKLNEVDQSAARASELLTRSRHVLSDEYAADDDFRRRCTAYNGVASRRAAAHFETDLDSFAKLYEQARQSDLALKDSFEAEDLSVLAKSRHQLDQLMPAASPGTQAPRVDTRALSQALVDLAALVKERDSATAALRRSAFRAADLAHQDLAHFAAQGLPFTAPPQGDGAGISTAAPSKELLTMLEDVRAKVLAPASLAPLKEAREEQERQVAEVMAKNHEFTQARNADETTLKRQQIIQGVNAVVTKFSDFHSQLSDASYFYGDLLARLQQIMNAIEGYVYAQQVVRQEFLEQQDAAKSKQSQEDLDAALAQRLAQELQMPPPAFPAGPATPGVPAHAAGMASFPGPRPPSTDAIAFQTPAMGQYSTATGPPVHGFGASAAGAAAAPTTAAPPSYSYQPGSGLGAPGYPPPSNSLGHMPPPTMPGAYSPSSYSMPSSTGPPFPAVLNTAAGQPAFTGAPPGYSAPPPAYPPAYGASPAPAYYSPHPVAGSMPGGLGSNPKVARLMEMGFPQDKVVAALRAHNDNEEAAANQLLSE